jgi:hypothetical protein
MLFTVGRPGKTQTKNPAFLILYGQTLINTANFSPHKIFSPKNGLVIEMVKQIAWGILSAKMTELESLYATASGLLQVAQSNERTPFITERCREVFAVLTAGQCFMKAHFFLVPLLSNSDLVDLGLTPHDTTRTPSGPPKAEMRPDTFLVGYYELWVDHLRDGEPHGQRKQGLPDLVQDHVRKWEPVTDTNQQFQRKRSNQLSGRSQILLKLPQFRRSGVKLRDL